MKHLFLIFLIFAAVLANTESAFAVQSHGGTEGLVSHLIGHVLFVVGMGYLLLRSWHKQAAGAGWFEFRVFLWLIIAWNVLTFSGHWMHEYVDKGKIIQADGRTISFAVSSITDAYYYLTRLDHLFLVPAFVFLLLALRKWRACE